MCGQTAGVCVNVNNLDGNAHGLISKFANYTRNDTKIS